MLSMSVFNEGLKEIENTYINKRFHLNDEQFATWYKWLKNMNDETYQKAIEEWCISQNSLPSPADLIALSSTLKTTDNTVQIPQNNEHCKYCSDAGLVSFKYRDSKTNAIYEQVFCCICEAGDYCKSIYQLPQINRNKLHLVFELPKVAKQNIHTITTKLVEQMSISDLTTKDKE